MSYGYPCNGFPDSAFTNISTHPLYPTDPIPPTQNHGPAPLARLQNSSEVHPQTLNHSALRSDPSDAQQQVLHEYPSIGISTQWYYPPTAAPPSSSLPGLYVNSQPTLDQQREQQQRYSAQNLEYHQPSRLQHHSQHTSPTPSSSAHDNAHPDRSYQTFLPPPPFPATGSQDAQSSVPATNTHVARSLTDAQYKPTAIPCSYDERHKISPKFLNRGDQANTSQADQHLGQAPVAPTYAYQTAYDDFQRSWSMSQGSFSRRSSSLANALEPVPSNPKQDRNPIKFEEAITSQSHNVKSAPSSAPSQSQSSPGVQQATIYPFSSAPAASKTNSCHVPVHRPRASHSSMPSSTTTIQIPKLPLSSIKQTSTSPSSKLSSPPSSQWSSPCSVDSKDELRQCGRNVAVLIPPSTMQRMPLQGDGAPIANMLADAVATNAHFPMPSLEQAVIPKSVPSTTYSLPLNTSSMSISGANIGKLVQQQIATAARKRGMSIPQHGATGVQHFSPYMAAKEQRDGRKVDVARMAELHAASVAATRGGSSTLVSSGSVGISELVSSALYPAVALAKQSQMPQTISIGSSLGGAGAVEGSRSSLADDGYGKEGKLGKKPFLACEFCRHRKIACGKGPTLPPHIVLPPGPRTCNQCFRRGLECQFPEASRRGLRHGKPSRRVIYGENNEYRIVDPEDEEYEDDEDEYPEEVEEIDVKGKGKGKAKVPARPWSPIRFVPAVDTEILKELSRKGVIERGGYA